MVYSVRNYSQHCRAVVVYHKGHSQIPFKAEAKPQCPSKAECSDSIQAGKGSSSLQKLLSANVKPRTGVSIALLILSKWNLTPCSSFRLTLKPVLGDYLCSFWSVDTFVPLNLRPLLLRKIFFYVQSTQKLQEGSLPTSETHCLLSEPSLTCL